MNDRELYAQILRIEKPWQVETVELRITEGEVLVKVERKGSPLQCPECRAEGPQYDSSERRWRHLDTCQLQTILVAKVPRVKCREHGVRQIRLPWAEEGSHFTTMFERLVIDWLLHVESIEAVATRMGLSWDQVDGIRARAVGRGIKRRGTMRLPAMIGIDETSFQRRHEYVTIVSGGGEGKVLWVGDDRSEATLDQFWSQFTVDERKVVEWVAMDMWDPYIASTHGHLEHAEEKIVFDKFHVVGHANQFVNDVRKQEHRALRQNGDPILKGSKYLWLRNPRSLRHKDRVAFRELRNSDLRTARAWAFKETVRHLWGYVHRESAEAAWKQFYNSAIHSTMAPVKKFARMIRNHWTGVVNAASSDITNAMAESINAGVQRIKRSACGFRNRNRFRIAILFHFGGLDLYPDFPSSIHSKT